MRPDLRHIPVLLLLGLLLAVPDQTLGRASVPDGWELHEIRMDENGALRKTSGDPYIVFPEVEQQVCTLSGIQFRIRLDPMPAKPSYMELFWRPTYEGFGEDRKVFFIVHPNKEGDTLNFTVPLEEQGGFKQIRLDLPGDLDSAVFIDEYRIVPLDALPEGTQLVDSYFRLSASATSNPAIMIPYLIKTLRHGIVRLANDPLFLAFWLLLILAALAAHRYLARASRSEG